MSSITQRERWFLCQKITDGNVATGKSTGNLAAFAGVAKMHVKGRWGAADGSATCRCGHKLLGQLPYAVLPAFVLEPFSS
jgi:hypothetical protein